MAKSKRHEVVLVIRTDKPCNKCEAVAMVKDCIHGDFYPTAWKDEDVEEFKVVTAKSTMRRAK